MPREKDVVRRMRCSDQDRDHEMTSFSVYFQVLNAAMIANWPAHAVQAGRRIDEKKKKRRKLRPGLEEGELKEEKRLRANEMGRDEGGGGPSATLNGPAMDQLRGESAG